MADSLNILLEPSEIVNLPVIGERAKSFAANVTAARFDVTNEDEVFLPPIVAPGLPSRNYFIFGKPISTKEAGIWTPIKTTNGACLTPRRDVPGMEASSR